MRIMKWIGFVAAAGLIISCFMPWVFIASKDIVVSGVDATGTSFGRPGYFHFITTFFFLLFVFIAKPWSARANLVVVVLNVAWAARNFFVIAMCRAGECPDKKIGLYLVVITSLVMLISALLPDIKMRNKG